MSRDRPTGGDVPWSFPVLVAQLPEAGLHQVIEATGAQRDLIAKVAGLNAVLHVTASFDLAPEAEGRVSVTGRVSGRVEQTCVVSLDAVENDIDEEVELVFAPPSQLAAAAKSLQKGEGAAPEIVDLPEPIVNGAIDLGQIATEFLILGIDPYPRRPGVAFVAPEAPQDPDEHPFAALKALKEKPAAPRGKKPKDK